MDEPPRMRLDPHLAALLQAEGGLTASNLTDMPLQVALAALRATKPAPALPPDQTALVEDQLIAGPDGDPLMLRLYRPPGAGPFGLMLHFHGGGWAGGSVANDDPRCHGIALAAGVIVVSVEYRLAPEHKFPAGLQDAYTALQWAFAQAASLGADADRIALGGASAGGNLAAACALLSHARGTRQARCLVLTYPVCDTSLAQPSHQENAEAPLLSSAMMAWFIGQYLPADVDKANPLVAVLRAPDFSFLPPALIITAGCDPLRDEGADYAARLRHAGKHTEIICYEGMVHGFITRAPHLPASRAAMAAIADFLTRHL